MRPHHRSEQVVGSRGIGDPVAQRFVDGRAQRAIAALHRDDLRAEPVHALQIGALAPRVHRSHVDAARNPHPGAGGGARHAVLPRSRFRHHPRRAQPARQEGLPHRVVDLVGARVRQVLALEPDLGLPEPPQTSGGRQGRRAASPLAQLAIHGASEFRVGERLPGAALQALQRGDERLRDEPAAERAEASALVGKFPRQEPPEQLAGFALLQRRHRAHRAASSPDRTARTKALIREGSLTPGEDSTPLLTSTA